MMANTSSRPRGRTIRRAGCPPSTVPCHRVRCRYHLWLDPIVDGHGAVIDLRESGAFGDLVSTCALRVAARGPHTFDSIGRILGLSRERIRQIEAGALVHLRNTDPGVLRELLTVVSDIQSDGEPREDDGQEPIRCDTAPIEAGEESTTDDTGLPDGADEPVADDTGSLPWSEPTYTDDQHADAYKAAVRRLRRTTEKASETRTYWCPHCGRDYPGVSIDGQARRGCPNPRCAGKAWSERARQHHARHRDIAPELVAAVRAEYVPGVHGFKTLARAHGLTRDAVRWIVQGHATREGA